jgi:nucleoside-triphosphatase
LYKKLCRYYFGIDPKATVNYVNAYREMWDSESSPANRGAEVYNGVVERNLLITGLPGTGKTTLVMRLVEKLKGVKAAGFYTEEIRTGGVRSGFEIVDLRGARTLLSHVDIPGRQRVGKYGVDVAGFERYLDTVPFLSPYTDLVVVDEIGRMEFLSGKFARLVVDLLDGPVMVVATIALRGGGIIDHIKNRADVRIYQVTKENRESLVGEIETAVREELARPAL